MLPQLITQGAYVCNKIIWIMEDDSLFAKIRRILLMIGGSMILTVIVTPLLTNFVFNGIDALSEETMKAIFAFISTPFAIVFTLTFSILEMIGYLITYGDTAELMFADSWTYPIMRIWCVIDHCIYMAIHLYGNYKGKKSGVMWKQFVWIFGAFTVAVILHWTHNNILGPIIAEALIQ